MLVAANYSMVHGPPIQYYSYTYNFLETDYSPYFRKPGHYCPPMEYQEGMMLPSSPLSTTQSDSDNSISSFDVISPPPEGVILSNSEIRCKWRSCGLDFPTLEQLAKHVAQVHSASGLGGLFYCGWEGCPRNDKGFNARYKMLVHVRTHTNEKPHMCNLCNKSFSRAENLKIHLRSHSGEKPYICPVPGCSKAYSNSSDRFKHTRTHQVEKPYQCKVPGCPKKYTDPSSLRKHIKTYKHYNISNDIAPKPIERKEYVDEKLYQSSQLYRENVIKHPYNDSKACCVSKCLTKNTDLFKITALLNLKQDKPKWDHYLEPYILPYEIKKEDFDVPLDLSLSKNF